jgi:phosphohistidine swiveling domain-containing protein
MFTVCAAEPPGPLQVRTSAAVAEMTTDAEPLVASVPDQAVLPLAVHAVALVVLQVSVTDCPAVTEAALEVKVTVGAEEAT